MAQALSNARRGLNRGTAILAAMLYVLPRDPLASAAPAPTSGAPPAPAEPTQPVDPADDPIPADPLAIPGPSATADKPPPPPTQPDEPSFSDDDTVVVRAGLDIDTSEAGPSGPVIVSRMEELGNLELRRAEILPSRLGTDPVIRIRVSLQPGASDVFLIKSDAAVRGQSLEGSAREISCSLCTEGEVVDRARGEIVRLVPFVRARFRPTEKKPEKPAAEAPKPEGPRPLGTLGKAGIGLLAGGTVVFATGLGLALAKPRPDPDDPTAEINTRPAGYGVLAVGGAALVTGAVLLILDRRQAKRSTVQFAPLGGRGVTGLVLLGRF